MWWANARGRGLSSVCVLAAATAAPNSDKRNLGNGNE